MAQVASDAYQGMYPDKAGKARIAEGPGIVPGDVQRVNTWCSYTGPLALPSTRFLEGLLPWASLTGVYR